MSSFTPPFVLVSESEQQAHQRENYEEHERRADRQPDIVQVDEIVVHEMLDHVDALVRVVAEEDVCLAEGLEQVHNGDHQNEPRVRRDHRQSDPRELFPPACAVEGSRFVQLRRDGVQRGEEEHHVIPRVLPEIQNQQYPERLLPRPIRRVHPEVFQHAVHHAEVGEDDLEEQHDRGHREHQREDEERAKEVVFLEVAKQEKRDEQRQNQDARQSDAEEFERVLRRELERRATEDVPVVFEPHELRRSHALGERHFEGDPEGDDEEHPEADESRKGEEEAGEGVLGAEG